MKYRKTPITKKKLQRRKKIIDAYIEMGNLTRIPLSDQDYNVLWGILHETQQLPLTPAIREKLEAILAIREELEVILGKKPSNPKMAGLR